MKKLATRLTVCILAVLAMVNYSSTGANQPQQASGLPTQLDKTTLRWQLPANAAQAQLLLALPDGTVTRQLFAAGTTPTLSATDASGVQRPDGAYVYELRVQLKADPASFTARQTPDEDGRSVARSKTVSAPEQALVQSGALRMLGGAIVLGGAAEEPQSSQTDSPKSQPASPNAPNDQVIADDLIVQSSICAGFDCVNGESFGFDTLRLKENNLRIGFADTSATAGFASNDWQITANDDGSGGLDKFSIDDITSGKTPFTIRAGAPNNALYLDAVGQLGLGTAVPGKLLDLNNNDTPVVRLNQNAIPWTAQTWDVGGNEANFFVRDVTGGSRLPLQIKPGAATSSLFISASSNVGIGTGSPSAKLDVNGNAHINGNLQVEGNVVEYSDVNAKENFTAIDRADLLNRLMEIPIIGWNYKADGAAVRHIGPTAQSFYSAFSLGQDNRHIAPLDTNGVALAAIQELYAQAQDKDAYISTLEQRLTDLEGKLQSLEQRLDALAQK